MITEYKIMNVPNQDFSVVRNGNDFLIRLRTYRGITYADVSVNGTLTNASMRCVPNKPIFTDEVNRMAGGIFKFSSMTDDYPHYESFNSDNCKFVFEPF